MPVHLSAWLGSFVRSLNRLATLGVLLAAAVPFGADAPAWIPARHRVGLITPDPFAAERLTFIVRIDGVDHHLRVASAFVLPGGRLPLEISSGSGGTRFRLAAAEGTIRSLDGNQWEWTAPAEPGLRTLAIIRDGGGETMQINVFVLVPFPTAELGRLNGYSIGLYLPPSRGPAIYRDPAGFIEVTAKNEEALLSPHFRLKQFVSRQPGGYPKYVVLRPELVVKLERLLERLNQRGITARTLQVMSGYRTPQHNRALGAVRYSMHQWGGAADVFVDEDGDRAMDDLDGDGATDSRDALVIAGIVEEMDRSGIDGHLVGGLGRYRANHGHGSYVHVDVRGFPVRWDG